MTTLHHEIIGSIRQQIFVLTTIQKTEYRVQHIHNKTNVPNTKNLNLQSSTDITRKLIQFRPIRSWRILVFTWTQQQGMFWAAQNTSSGSKHLALVGGWLFLRSRKTFQTCGAFYDFDRSELLFSHSLAASVSRYCCLGWLGCSGYSSSIAPSSNAGRK